MANLEDTPAWKAILPLLSQMSIPALAKKMNVHPGELAVALKRTGTSRVAARAAGSPPPEPIEGGEEEDGLPPEPRAAAPRTERATERPAAPSRKAEPASGAPEAATGQRSSKLDRHRDLIGAMPDAAVAAKVGMSIQAVRNYRQKHGISAAGRRRTPEELGINSAVPQSIAYASSAPAAEVAGGAWAWRVVFAGHPPRIVLADDVASAASRAQSSGYGAVTLIERLNEAL